MSITAPVEASSDSDGYPVLFWIHGGAFEQGLGNCDLYNGTTFAQNNVVLVTINYRLGVMGFLASEEMTGNYGIADQVLALKYVNSNIKGFGGNPNKVTIAGQSAGAMSVGTHIISSASKGLFQQAIMESNPLALPFHTRSSAAKNAKSAFDYLSCSTLACMKTKTPAEILDAQAKSVKLNLNNLLINFLPFCPMVDAAGIIPDQPFTALAGGALSAMSMLQGSMYDEGQLFVNELFTSSLSKLKYEGVVKGTFGKAASKILDMYPFSLSTKEDGRDPLQILTTDLLFLCPLRNITRGYTAVNGAAANPTYMYRFKHILSFDAWGPNYPYCIGYVCHGSELPFVFNAFSAQGLVYSPTKDEIQLASDLGQAWANFVSSGNPSTGLSIPLDYPLYTVSSAEQLIVLDEPSMGYDYNARGTFCDLWDSIGYYY